VAAVAIAAAAATWFAARAWAPAPPVHPVRFEISGPRHRELLPDAASVSLSPDGQTVAMIATDSSFTPSIWIRRLDSLTPRELPGTENATLMFWSPDSRYLAFFAGDHLLSKIAIAGGEPERICEVKVARGGTWNRNGVILLAPYSNGGIYRVSASGGEPVAITQPDSTHGETGNRFPFFLPDGHHFLYTGVPAGADGKFSLYVGSLQVGAPQPLMRVESGAIYCDPGWLLTTRDNALVAQRFDARSRRLKGEPQKVGDNPLGSLFSGGPRISASFTGALGYLTRIFPAQRLSWMDLAGHETAIPGFASGLYGNTIVSPDGRRALLESLSDDFKNIVSVVDLERGTVSRVTTPDESPTGPVWSPDGRRIAYLNMSNQTLVVRSLADGSTRSYLAADHAYKTLEEWSRDGRYLLFGRLDATTKFDIWLLPLEGDSTPRVAVRTAANDAGARLSPDGRRVAFTSDETGVPEVYVQDVGSTGLKYQVTTGGGGAWYWSRDGKSLVFVRADRPRDLLRAAVQGKEEFSLGPPKPFLRLPEDMTYAYPDSVEKRFLMLLPAEKPDRQTITVLQNWQAALRKP